MWNNEDVSKTTYRIMDSLERRIEKLLQMETCAGGLDENIERCDRQKTRLLRYVAEEVEKLAQKAGCE